MGDLLEYKVRVRTTKPQVENQFWFEYDFMKTFIVKSEVLTVNVPRDKYVKLDSPDYKAVVQEQGQRKVYTWETSNLNVAATKKSSKPASSKKPSVQGTTFKSWGEVGAWYEALQKPQLATTSQLQAKAAELVKGLTSDDEKIHAIYNYVATRFHYVSLSFGVGRYQPHAAQDVLENEYGDCKDKHTLLAALLKAAGFEAWPALMNSERKIDPEVPSPGQFNHVITVVPRGQQMVWLDTTPEVAPFGLLLDNLRNKLALVVPSDQPASLKEIGSLMTTPEQPPFRAKVQFVGNGALSADGTYTGRVTLTLRGDQEVLYRLAFRNTPQPQWKDLAQSISYGMGFGGEASNVTASQPDDTSKPFEYTYDYTRKNYGDWSNHRTVAPVPWFGIESNDKTEEKPDEPVRLGAIGDWEFSSVTKLPEGYAPSYKDKLDVTEDFADYHAEYSIANGVLKVSRRLVIKQSEVPVSSWEKYKKFCKILADERDRFISLETGATVYPEGEGPKAPSKPTESSSGNGATATGPSTPRKTPQEMFAAAKEANPAAGNLMEQAAEAWQKQDYTRAEHLTQQALALDPRFFGAHASLGLGYLMRLDPDKALAEFRKEVEYHPENPGTYMVMTQVLLQLHRDDEALAATRKWVAADPGNSTATEQLQMLLEKKHDTSGAQQVLEEAHKNAPDDAALQFSLAKSYLESGRKDEGVALLKKAKAAGVVSDLEAASALATANTELDLAMDYAKAGLAAAEQQTLQAQTDDEGYRSTATLAFAWDTMGWVLFRQGQYPQSLPFLRSAWLLTQAPEAGDQLGQLYEKLGRTHDAIETYKLALALPGKTHQDTLRRYQKLSNDKSADPDVPALRRGPGGAVPSPGEQLSRMRSFKLPYVPGGAGSGVFTVIFSQDGLDLLRFQSGDEAVKVLTPKLSALKFKTEFPNATPAKVFRRGILFCSKIAGCDFVLALPSDVWRFEKTDSN